MATKNFFDLLGDDENEDPFQVVVRTNSFPVEAKPTPGAVKKPGVPVKMPTKSTPADAVKDSLRGQYGGPRGGRGGRGGRSGRGNYGDRDGVSREGGYRERNYSNDRSVSQTRDADGFVEGGSSFVEKPLRMENAEGRYYEGGRGEGRGGRGHGEGEEPPRRREFDRHSGNARGNETAKRAGAGRGNWGTDVDITEETVETAKDEEVPAVEADAEMKPGQEISDATLEESAADAVKGEEEDNEMTLEEYEKVLEEKRKALEAEKASERKVEVDKAFEKMQLVDNKKRENDIFIKLFVQGQDKDKEKVKREAAEREEKSRKPVSINEFLKPAEGGKYYGPLPNHGRGGRGGRGDRREGGDRRDVGGRGDRDSSRFGGGRFGGTRGPVGGASAPKIEDQVQFPTLGGK